MKGDARYDATVSTKIRKKHCNYLKMQAEGQNDLEMNIEMV